MQSRDYMASTLHAKVSKKRKIRGQTSRGKLLVSRDRQRGVVCDEKGRTLKAENLLNHCKVRNIERGSNEGEGQHDDIQW